MVAADAMQGLAETLEVLGFVSLRQLLAFDSWLSLFENGLPPDGAGMSVRDLVSPELRSLRKHVTDSLHVGSAAGAGFALCQQEWEAMAQPFREQLLKASDLLHQVGSDSNEGNVHPESNEPSTGYTGCRGRSCRAWALLHGLALWTEAENLSHAERVLKVPKPWS